MKLQMHSFDFEECTLTFSVPKEIIATNSFGFVPGGVDVDLVTITKNKALSQTTPGCPQCKNWNVELGVHMMDCFDCKRFHPDLFEPKTKE